jgi:hypothetical protein
VVQSVEVYRGKPILYDTGDFLDDYAVDDLLRNDLSALFREDIHEALMVNNRPRGRPISPIQVAIAIAVIIAIWVYLTSAPGGPERVSYSQVLKALENKPVAEAQIRDSEVGWKLRDADQWMVSTRIPGVDDSEIVEQLRQSGAEITGEVPSSIWPLVLSWGTSLALLAVFWFLIVGRMGGH